MTEHTPGPWRACGDGKCSCKTVSCGDYPIAQVTHGPWGDDYPSIRLVGTSSLDIKAEAYMEQINYGEVPEPLARANALLIAAAPELLKELKNCVRLLADLQAEEGLVQKQARAVIAKAEGKNADHDGEPG